jgi:hypothetical protein
MIGAFVPRGLRAFKLKCVLPVDDVFLYGKSVLIKPTYERVPTYI